MDNAQVNWANDHAMTVVMAANGYPGAYEKGTVIKGLDAIDDDNFNVVFHAGTASETVQSVATGGRVLNVTARGATLADAHQARLRNGRFSSIGQKASSRNGYRLARALRALRTSRRALPKTALLNGPASFGVTSRQVRDHDTRPIRIRGAQSGRAATRWIPPEMKSFTNPVICKPADQRHASTGHPSNRQIRSVLARCGRSI